MNVATFNGRRLDWRGLLALLLLPVLLAGAFLGATWGFDANLRKVQAAIVNNDEMVELNGQQVPLGRQLSAALVDSDKEQNFTWVLADEANAARGLASGRYAAVVTIPKNFSASVTSFAGEADAAHQATISIETSPVAGIAETAVGQAVAEAAARSLNTTMTKSYLDQVYLGFNENKKGMTAVADGARKLADGTTQLSDGLDEAASGGRQLKDGGAQLADGASQLGDGLGQAASGAQQLKDGGAQLADGASQLGDGLGLMAAQTKDLPAGVSKLADGTDQLAGGLGQLAAAGPQLSSGATQLAGGASSLAGGVDTFAGGLKQYTGGVDQYVGGINQIVVPVRKVVEALPDLTGVLDSLDAVMADLPARATALDAQVQQVATQLRALLGDADKLNAASGTVLDGLAKAKASTAALASGQTAVACPEALKDTPDACAAFAAGVQAGGRQASTALTSVDTTQLDAARASLNDHRAEILAALDKVTAASAKLVQDAPALQAQWDALRRQIPPGTSPNATLLAQLTQLEQGGNQLIAAGDQLNAGAAQLGTGAHQLADGAGTFATGLQQYTDGVGSSASGAGQLASGMRQLADQLPQLVDGIAQLAAGASQLGDGVAQYTDGVGQLSDGLQQLAPGATQLADGVAQYTDGAGKLVDGVATAASGSRKLADGTTELADGLASGVKQIPTYDDLQREKLSTVVAAPISTTGLDALVTPGAAGTSLLLVLALWLGALATYALIKPVDPRNAASSSTTAHLMIRTLLPGAAVSAVQAAVLAGIGAGFLGLAPAVGFALFGALLLAGLAFTAVNHALAAWGGVWGRLVSGVMLLITGVTALTYSAPAVFDTLRGLSAASPGLDAARAIITGHSPALTLVTLGGWLAVGLLAGWYAIARSRTVSVKRLALAG